MAHEEEKLPWDLMEEILSRVPPKSLVRFRAVSKPWNNLFNDKRFINNHKTTFHFVLATKSKIYSVNVANPNKIVVRELTLDIPGLDEPKELIDCNEFLLFHMNEGAVVWNPWLRQSTWIEPVSNQDWRIDEIGYDNNRSYKITGFCNPSLRKIYDFASDSWKDLQLDGGNKDDGNNDEKQDCDTLMDTPVSLNGTLYWVSYNNNKDCLFITGFDFSTESFFVFCDLPCGKNHDDDVLVLGIFKGDRFSLLKQCYATKKIEIFVTKDKITTKNRNDVVWMSFMQVSIPNFPALVHKELQPSFFIDNDNRLIMCSCDESGQAWIYVMWQNKLISKIQLDSVVDPSPLHCTYTPSLVMVPSIRRQEV